MSLTLDQTSHVMANALHRTIANLLQLSFIQLCQQAVSFNSSLKVLGVVCLNVDEGNDIIIKLNDTVERDGDDSPPVIGPGRGDLGSQVKQTSGAVQAFTLASSNNGADKAQARASVSGIKKRKVRTENSSATVTKSTPASEPIATLIKSDLYASHIDSTFTAVLHQAAEEVEENGATSTGQDDANYSQAFHNQVTQQAGPGVSSDDAGPTVSPLQTQSKSKETKQEWSQIPTTNSNDSESDAARLPFGGFVRTHRVENLPFACAQCAAQFDRASKLREHALSTAHLAYQCTACPAKFKSWRNVQRHAVHHLSYKPYGCGICQKGFSRRDHALKHIQAVHRVQPADTALVNVMMLRRSGTRHQEQDIDGETETHEAHDQDMQDEFSAAAADVEEVDDEKPELHYQLDEEADTGGGGQLESASTSGSTATSGHARTDMDSERDMYDLQQGHRLLSAELVHVPPSARGGKSTAVSVSVMSRVNDPQSVVSGSMGMRCEKPFGMGVGVSSALLHHGDEMQMMLMPSVRVTGGAKFGTARASCSRSVNVNVSGQQGLACGDSEVESLSGE